MLKYIQKSKGVFCIKKDIMLDDIDNQIIKILQNHGRISHEEISKKLNLSRPAIHQRIAKLEQEGIILGYSATINWGKLGYNIRVLVSLKVKTDDFHQLMSEISQIKMENVVIEECHRATGQWCIILKIRTINTDYITKFHDRLLKVNQIVDTSTILLLSSY